MRLSPSIHDRCLAIESTASEFLEQVGSVLGKDSAEYEALSGAVLLGVAFSVAELIRSDARQVSSRVADEVITAAKGKA